MEYRFTPKGVCSKEMIVEMEGDIIKSLKILGGCPGNTVGLTSVMLGTIGFVGGIFSKNFAKDSKLIIMLMIMKIIYWLHRNKMCH